MRTALAVAALLFSAGTAMAQAEPPFGEDVLAAVRRISVGEKAAGLATLESLAGKGRTDAALAAGEVLQSGMAGTPDPQKACGYYQRAAQDHPSGMHNLALCHETGATGPADLAKAAKLYEQAAQRGFGKSMCALGNLLMEGRGVVADPARAIQLCTQGAATGDIDAMTDLGNFYLQGQGVPRNVVKARELYEPAAAKGQRNAAYVLGQIYWNGDGTPKNPMAASRWWRVAYDAGRIDASKLLGMAAMARTLLPHKKGETTPGLAEEIAWYDQALAKGPPSAAVEDLKLARGLLSARLKLESQ